jgi:hypothetical protein
MSDPIDSRGCKRAQQQADVLKAAPRHLSNMSLRDISQSQDGRHEQCLGAAY